MKPIYAGIEAGGTKIVCAIGDGPQDLRFVEQFPTTTPAETLEKIIQYLHQNEKKAGGLSGVGIASFGPLDLNRGSPTYGSISATPKPGWSGTNLLQALQGEFNIPAAIDTDVNGAALGEWRWGAGRDLDVFTYMTVGTGIGGGIIVGGKPIHGLVHPEMGHVRIPHQLQEDPFPGICPFHLDCLEGLANGPAIEKRWGVRGEKLPDDHLAWSLEAQYLALACVDFICTFSPERIIIGGGVMSRAVLFPLIRQKVLSFLNGYVNSPLILDHIEDYIVPPTLGNRCGVLGAIALAQIAAGLAV